MGKITTKGTGDYHDEIEKLLKQIGPSLFGVGNC
jgi:hypothetical protein